MTDDTERGAFIPPSDVYCDPEKSDTDSAWEVRPTKELDECGMYRCPICFDDSETDGGDR